MSNTPNLKYRRRILMKRFASTGAASVNDCWRPPSDASKADLAELHREKMRIKKAKRQA